MFSMGRGDKMNYGFWIPGFDDYEPYYQKEDNWQTNLEGNIKGRIAEVIVEQMFKRSGQEVYFFGTEWRQLSKKENGLIIQTNKGELNISASEFEKPPDFVLAHSNNEESYEFIEVKFRYDGILLGNRDEQDIDDMFCAFKKVKQRASLILLDRSTIEVIVYPYVRDGQLVKESVLSQKEWDIHEDVFEECLRHLRLYKHFFPKK